MRHLAHQATRSRPACHVERRRTVCIVGPHAGGIADWRTAAQDNSVDVHVFANAEAALSFASSTTIDLWLVNAHLPGISGCELCQMLKGQTSAATVWIVADEYSADVERQALASRATMFICRETLNQAIEPALQSLAARSSMQREKPYRL